MQRILQRVGGGSGGRAVGRVGVPAIHEQPLRCGGGGGGHGLKIWMIRVCSYAGLSCLIA